MKLARLEEFRQAVYKYLGTAKDATFVLKKTEVPFPQSPVKSPGAPFFPDLLRSPSRNPGSTR